MAGKPTMRCTVTFGGARVETELLYAIPYSAIDKELYDPPPTGGKEMRMPPTPEEDGVYLLIDNAWIREED